VPHPNRNLPLAILAAVALQLSLVSIADAERHAFDPSTQGSTRALSQNIEPYGGYRSQKAARAAHPITQGGTTGGTINPGLTSDHRQHGYNG
jgi:hypothetical protein